MTKMTGGVPDMARALDLVRAWTRGRGDGSAAGAACRWRYAAAGRSGRRLSGQFARTAEGPVPSGWPDAADAARPGHGGGGASGLWRCSCRRCRARARAGGDAARLHAGPRGFRPRHPHERPCVREGLHVLRPTGPGVQSDGVLELVRTGPSGAGWGEPALIMAMIDSVSATQGIAPGRYRGGTVGGRCHGCGSGGEYPERFAAAGAHSGRLRARPVPSRPSGCQRAAGRPGRTKVPLIVFHGDADATVSPRNGAALAAGIGPGPQDSGTTGGRGWSRTCGPDGEFWTVQGLGHAWSGGSPEGSHADPAGPDASTEARFFLGRSFRIGGRGIGGDGKGTDARRAGAAIAMNVRPR